MSEVAAAAAAAAAAISPLVPRLQAALERRRAAEGEAEAARAGLAGWECGGADGRLRGLEATRAALERAAGGLQVLRVRRRGWAGRL